MIDIYKFQNKTEANLDRVMKCSGKTQSVNVYTYMSTINNYKQHLLNHFQKILSSQAQQKTN